MQKLFSFFVVGLVPILIASMMLATGFGLIWSLFIPMVFAFVTAYIGNVITSQNPFIKAIQGDGLLAFDFNSSGIARVFVVNVDVPDLNIKTKHGNEKRVYDRMISLVLREPQPANFKEVNGKTLEFTIPTEEYQKSVFKHQQLNFMIFNSQTGMFLTKEFLANMEKTLMVEYVTLNEWRELKEMNKTIRDFTRGVMDTVLHKVSGQLLGNPIVKIVVAIVVGLIIIMIAIQTAPLIGLDIGGIGLPAMPSVVQTAPTAPIATQGNTIVGLIPGWF